MTIARRLRRLDDPACFPRWMFRILERRCADWIRRRQTERRRAVELAEVAEAEPVDSSSSAPAADVLGLREAIARLDADARHLLKLFYSQWVKYPGACSGLDGWEAEEWRVGIFTSRTMFLC